MSNYSVERLIAARKDTAHIEAFFTTKGNDLYCILPAYQPQIRLTGIQPPHDGKASILGTDITAPVRKSGNDCIIDLSSLQVGDLPHKIFTLKLTQVK